MLGTSSPEPSERSSQQVHKSLGNMPSEPASSPGDGILKVVSATFVLQQGGQIGKEGVNFRP